mgnify:FL=1
MKVFVNCLTTFRFIFTLFLPFIKKYISNFSFISSIAVLFLTDFFDGKLARKYNVQTIYGSAMDTIADKTLSIVLLFMLVKDIPILVYILIFEIIIALINIIAFLQGKKTKSSYSGKVKMWFLAISIIIGFMNNFKMINNTILMITAFSTIIIQSITIIDYIKRLSHEKKHQDRIKWKDLKIILFDTNYYLTKNEI